MAPAELLNCKNTQQKHHCPTQCPALQSTLVAQLQLPLAHGVFAMVVKKKVTEQKIGRVK